MQKLSISLNKQIVSNLLNVQKFYNSKIKYVRQLPTDVVHVLLSLARWTKWKLFFFLLKYQFQKFIFMLANNCRGQLRRIHDSLQTSYSTWIKFLWFVRNNLLYCISFLEVSLSTFQVSVYTTYLLKYF